MEKRIVGYMEKGKELEDGRASTIWIMRQHVTRVRVEIYSYLQKVDGENIERTIQVYVKSKIIEDTRL